MVCAAAFSVYKVFIIYQPSRLPGAQSHLSRTTGRIGGTGLQYGTWQNVIMPLYWWKTLILTNL